MVESEDLKEYYEQVYARRGLLTAVAACVAAILLGSTSSDSVESDVADTESDLKDLATFLNQRQMADPNQIEIVIGEIESTLSTVSTLLDTQSVQSKRNENQALDARITAIETARDYYTALRDVLTESRTIRQTLRQREENAVFERELQPKIQGARFEEFSSQVAPLGPGWLSETADQKQSTVSQLLPEFESVSEELQNQIVLYQSHFEKQESYINAGEQIRTALEHREAEEYDSALSELDAAEATSGGNVPQEVSELSLGENSMTLAQYEQVFRSYQSAISTIAAASEPPIDPSRDNEAVGTGLGTLIEAREIVTEAMVG